MHGQRLLTAALIGLALLYLVWFHDGSDRIAAWLVFALPPSLLAWRCHFGRGRAGFWSGVLALFWFAHAVMVIWSRHGERHYALAALLLSLVVIYASSAPGLRARFAKPS